MVVFSLAYFRVKGWPSSLSFWDEKSSLRFDDHRWTALRPVEEGVITDRSWQKLPSSSEQFFLDSPLTYLMNIPHSGYCNCFVYVCKHEWIEHNAPNVLWSKGVLQLTKLWFTGDTERANNCIVLCFVNTKEYSFFQFGIGTIDGAECDFLTCIGLGKWIVCFISVVMLYRRGVHSATAERERWRMRRFDEESSMGWSISSQGYHTLIHW